MKIKAGKPYELTTEEKALIVDFTEEEHGTETEIRKTPEACHRTDWTRMNVTTT